MEGTYGGQLTSYHSELLVNWGGGLIRPERLSTQHNQSIGRGGEDRGTRREAKHWYSSSR